jgi:SAM-dependent methyltransferase
MADYIHGSSDDREVARLEKQAGFIAPLFQPHLRAKPGQRVLDLATGVGAMAGELRKRFPSIEIVGIDLRRSQLEHAHRNHGELSFVQGDATRMPFADDTFDHVHCSWLLEHVPSPVAVLKDVRRVLKPGGDALFIEVDNASFRSVPEFPEVVEISNALNDAQLKAGGDPFVGQKLDQLFREAGFTKVEILPCRLLGSAKDPAFFEAFITEFAEIFESVDEALGPAKTERIHTAARKLRELSSIPGSELHYRSFIGRGTK